MSSVALDESVPSMLSVRSPFFNESCLILKVLKACIAARMTDLHRYGDRYFAQCFWHRWRFMLWCCLCLSLLLQRLYQQQKQSQKKTSNCLA